MELGKSWGVKMKSCQTAPVVWVAAIALRVTAAAHRPPSFLSLAGCCPAQCPATGMDVVLIGGSAQQDVPVLDDENAIKLLRLIRVMRRLRELQRGVTMVEEEHDE